MRLRELAEKSVAIWGLGKEGESALRCLRARFPDKFLTILSDLPVPEDRQQAMASLGPIVFLSGQAVAEALCRHDVVIKSPGISLYKQSVQQAKEQGTLFTSTANLFFAELSGRTVIAVTGTKGKSTTASMIHYCLLKLGISSEICGNIGKPFLDFLDKASANRNLGGRIIQLSDGRSGVLPQNFGPVESLSRTLRLARQPGCLLS